MTQCGFHKVTAISANHRWRAEADNPYLVGFDQPNVTYRLFDLTSGKCLWERCITEASPTPHELYVSDQGQLISFSNSLQRAAVIVRDPTGEERLRVGLVPVKTGSDPRVNCWIVDPHIVSSTAGYFWSYDSMVTFFGHSARRFSVRTVWGRRLLFDLDEYRFLDVPALDESDQAQQAEKDLATSHLRALLGPAARGESYDVPRAAITSLILDRCYSAAPLLTELEHWGAFLGCDESECYALRNGRRSTIAERTLAALALRVLGVLPSGEPCCEFRDAKSGEVLAYPVRFANRDRLVHSLSTGTETLTSRGVLRQIGVPDLIAPYCSKGSKGSYVWGERWWYLIGLRDDLEVLCLMWEAGSEGAALADRHVACANVAEIISRITAVPGTWSDR